MAKKLDLTGAWDIQVSQKVNKKRLSYIVGGDIAQIGAQVIGTLHYDLRKINYDFTSTLKNKRRFKVSFSGTVNKDQFHFQYRNNNRKINQYGSACLTITSEALMEGNFVGFGPESKGPILGKIKFMKVKE